MPKRRRLVDGPKFEKMGIVALNIIFSVTYFWIYTLLFMFIDDVVVDQVNLLMFYIFQTTNITFVGKM